MSPSVTGLQRLLWACEQVLDSIDMTINVKKSCCMRIGARHDKPCAKITTVDWRELVMADEIRYLGVFVTRRRPRLGDVVTLRRYLVFVGRRVTSLHGD